MTDYGQRRERVAAGSRRQRDLDAVRGDKPSVADRYSDEMAWAARHLPDEHAPFVAVAVFGIRRAGRVATPENVLERMREQGRTREQLYQ